MPPIVKCSDILYRGPQLRPHEWQALLDLGIRTVVNLREEDPSEHEQVVALGMTPVFIPVVDCQAPTVEQVWQFIRVAEVAESQPVYVHCRGGVGRTGVMVCCHRIYHGMAPEDALRLNSRELWDTGMDLNAEQETFVRAFR